MSISKPQNASLVDNLSQGFQTINRKLWVVLVPILLNIYLWYGAQVSFGPLITDFLRLAQSAQADSPYADELRETYDRWGQFGQQDFQQRIAVLNYVPTLTLYAGGAPLPEYIPQAIDQQRTVLEVRSVVLALGVITLINVLAVPLSAVFLALLASAVRDDREPAAVWARRFGQTLMYLLGYIGIVIIAALVLGLPFFVLAALLSVVSMGLGLLLVALLQIAAFWVGVYIGFAPEAIAISGLGPIRALRASFAVVRRNFWGTLALLGISFIITVGCGVIWREVVGSQIGLIVAIIGSAYIGSGLLAARMVFYRERLHRLQSVRPA